MKERDLLIQAILDAVRILKVSDTLLNSANAIEDTDGDQEMNEVSSVKVEVDQNKISGIKVQELKDRVGDIIADAILLLEKSSIV